MQKSGADPHGIEKLRNQPAARFWRVGCFLFSASMLALSMLDASNEEYFSALELFGSALVLAGLSCRSLLVAAALCVPEGAEKAAMVQALVRRERTLYPWVRVCVRGGWLLLLAGLALTLLS
jgi:hypothetical protein